MTREKKEWCVDALRLGQELSLGQELNLALACVDALRLGQQLSLIPPLSRPHNARHCFRVIYLVFNGCYTAKCDEKVIIKSKKNEWCVGALSLGLVCRQPKPLSFGLVSAGLCLAALSLGQRAKRLLSNGVSASSAKGQGVELGCLRAGFLP
jgi:hypothetical protein